MLDHDQLESIRMMTNHDMDSSTPFATILVGQPTLRHSVKLGVLAALEQRITVRYQMKGMTPDETAGYIRHHLEQAGRTAELFTDDAIAQIHQAARGKPRTVNNICTAVERRSGFPWREAVAAPGTPMATPGQAGSLAAAPCR